MRDYALEIYASKEVTHSALVGDVVIGDQKYKVTTVAMSNYNDKDGIVRRMTSRMDDEFQDKMLSNLPGSSEEWIRFMGRHEGAHHSRPDGLSVLAEEVRADKITIADLSPEMALAAQDVRALSNCHDKNPYT